MLEADDCESAFHGLSRRGSTALCSRFTTSLHRASNKMTDFRTTERYRKMIKSGCLPDRLLILRRLKEDFHIGRARD